MLAATVIAGLRFHKMMHSALAICFIVIIDPRPVTLHTVFEKNCFNTARRCRRDAVSYRRAQLSMPSDAETFPVFEKINSLRTTVQDVQATVAPSVSNTNEK